MASKYTRSAKGRECTVRIPGVCSFNTEETIFAHLNGAGWSRKFPDIMGCYACARCHAFLDYDYANQGWTRQDRDLAHYRATMETQEIMIKDGILIL